MFVINLFASSVIFKFDAFDVNVPVLVIAPCEIVPLFINIPSLVNEPLPSIILLEEVCPEPVTVILPKFPSKDPSVTFKPFCSIVPLLTNLISAKFNIPLLPLILAPVST